MSIEDLDNLAGNDGSEDTAIIELALDVEGTTGNAESSDKDSQTGEQAKTLPERIREFAEQITLDDVLGEFVLPEKVDEDLKEYIDFAIALKTQDVYAIEKVRSTVLAEKYTERLDLILDEVSKGAQLQLSQVQIDELEDLKVSDPEVWRKKLNTYEAEAKKTTKAALKKKLSDSDLDLKGATELAVRKKLLADYNRQHPDTPLTDQFIEEHVPPTLVKQLSSGKITFKTFLSKIQKYVAAPKKIAPDTMSKKTNINKGGGGRAAGASKVKTVSYKDLTF